MVELNLYMEHPAVTAMSADEAAAWRRKHRVQVSGGTAPKPVRTFLEAAFPEFLTADIEATNFRAPTPIQSQCWPVALSGCDLIGLAATGSGKTLCFALPAITHIVAQPRLQPGDGAIALMLAPTRELALQIKGECDAFGGPSGVTNTAIYGGVPKGPQQRDLQQGVGRDRVEIVIATPGRLLDFMEAGVTNLRRVSFLADRMLDLGFEPQLRRMAAQLLPQRQTHPLLQTLLFSATWPREVCATSRSGWAASCGCCRRRGCEAIRNEVRRRGIGAEALHGDKSQHERDWVLQQFKQGAAPVLVATDVASRGLDVQDVRAVVNYDAPSQAEDYVHRVGRAGRAGASGRAYTLLTSANAAFARELAAMLRRQGARVPQELGWLASSTRGGEQSHRRWRSDDRGHDRR
ncbi:hypothetical protein EMIHUDRAFT_311127 [Emiliania huxleyi CCMP1516]|uniref:RNA helicase n=2 Tax=Emiliania huxleyi TaxID=2903 RepID=A0A0D3IT52_EMIH1|nr:hypothetical protein EMIHUDRAFT_311127 [Emiliania huxleyi CCMP1516]EOD14437.1 hypothetical protein EMIHUDRAFT_311127 [Emiliania huxleyi CCMP1516]|eukprot:XP_005766866.1 hypothetical protein EMIHUDRAFT_311127 [Emiliania huxleyi CCMP1516]